MKHSDHAPPESEHDFERMRRENGIRRATRPEDPATRGNADRGVLGEGSKQDSQEAASGDLDSRKSQGSGHTDR